MAKARCLLVVIAIVGGVLVEAAATASAVLPCPTTTPNCLTANDDNYTAAFKAKLVVVAPGVLANDLGPTNATVDLPDSDKTTWNGGKVAVRANGSFTYTPPTTPFTGIDSFDYTIQHGDDTDFATAYITVLPVVVDDTYNVPADQTLTIGGSGVLTNDQGVDPTTITVDAASVQGGDIDDNDNGAFDYTPAPGFTGIDSFTYNVFDLDFDNSYTGTVYVNVDGAPPVVSLSAPGAVTLATTVSPRWSGSDDTGIAHYDVQENAAPWNAGFKGWVNYKIATVVTTSTAPVSMGRTYCFRVQATDLAGNVSGWSQRCTAVPLRAASLVYSKGWVSTASSVYYGGVGVRTSTKGLKATRTSAQAQHIWLVATKCSTCGTAQVRWNNVVIANVNLHSAATAHKQLIPVAAFTAVKTGTLTVTVTSTGKPVLIEGLALLRG